jgi:glycosyltransferase 2 family protein
MLSTVSASDAEPVICVTVSTTDVRSTIDIASAEASENEITSYFRSPVDVLHLVSFLVIALIALGLTAFADEAVLAFEEDLVRLFNFLSPSVERVLAGVAKWAFIVLAVGVYLFPIVTRRLRLLGYLAAAGVLSVLLMAGVGWLLDRGETSTLVTNEIAERAGVDSFLDTSVAPLAQLAAMFVVLSPFVDRAWRKTGGVVIGVAVVLRLLVAYHLPAALAIALPLGAAAGAAVLVFFGRPDRRPTLDSIAATLRSAGLPAAEVRAAKVDARGSTPYFATLADGQRLFVKVLGQGERAADLLFRVYRFIRLKNVGDDRPFSSLRRTVEHEALVALMARDVGVPTPRLRAVAQVGGDSMLLAYDAIDGSSLDGMADEAITDDIMTTVWQQVQVLRDHRIAHRDLRRANVFVDTAGHPYLIDFGFSELAESDGILNADVAQMMASFCVVASPERTVRVAIEVMGRDVIAEALPRLQMNALSGATQEALKVQKGRLKALQQEVMRQCDIGELKFEELQRLNGKTVLTLAVLAGAVYFLIPQFADLPGIIDQVKSANWAWFPVVLLASTLTYLAATASLSGAIPDRLPTGPLLAAQVGSSFASKLAPAGLGGMALNVRFLQKHGVDEPVAVSGVGLNSAIGFVGHMSLVAVFFLWAGNDAFKSFRLPDPKWFVVGIGVASAMVAVGLLVPQLRRIMLGNIWPIIRTALGGMGHVFRSPQKFSLLLGGSITVTFSYLLALYLATQAFGGGLPFATIGAVYLVGAVVASAAPTPGGLGAMEAALIAGLVAAGMENTVAVPAVFLYRLATFWMPILPGWLCFQWLQRRDHI